MPKAGVWLHGATGRMGVELQQALAAGGDAQFQLLAGSSRSFHDYSGEHGLPGGPVDAAKLGRSLRSSPWQLLLDFSTEAGNRLLLDALDHPAPLSGQAVLLGTTGLAPATWSRWEALAMSHHLRLLIAPNTSVGILMLAKAALLAAVPLSRLGFDVEIVETHHRRKKDAPSGTARFLAETLAAGVDGLEVVTERRGERQPGELGVHAVRGGGVFGEHSIRLIGDDEELTLSHRAFSRRLFARGALVLGNWVLQQEPGLYRLQDVTASALAL